MQSDIEMRVIEDEPVEMQVIEGTLKPEQTVDVTPTYEPQTVLPDEGMTIGRVNVEAIPDPTEEATFTENGDYNVARIGTAHVDVQPTLDSATVTPTEQTQTVTPRQGYDGLSEVTVNPIPSEYVVPTGSVDITANGQGIDIAGKATANVNVPGIVPSGTKQISITANGTTTEDVTNYADAEIIVDVPTGIQNGIIAKLIHEVIEVGENTITDVAGMWTYILQAKHGQGSVCMVSPRTFSTLYNNYLGHGCFNANYLVCARYRNGVIQYVSFNAAGYDIVCPAGTILDCYSCIVEI